MAIGKIRAKAHTDDRTGSGTPVPEIICIPKKRAFWKMLAGLVEDARDIVRGAIANLSKPSPEQRYEQAELESIRYSKEKTLSFKKESDK